MNAEEIRKLIEDVNLREKKNYPEMKIEELSKELREVMAFEQEIFQKIDSVEKNKVEQDLITYAKIIIKNTTQREISEIQEVYLKKIDSEYLGK